MRRSVFATCAIAALFTTSCGYIGPVLPPSLHLPVAVSNLVVIERGDALTYQFTLPKLTTDGEKIREFQSIDLSVGPNTQPFDFDGWAASAKHYPIAPPEPVKKGDNDTGEAQQIKASAPLAGWPGKQVAIAVRTAIRGDRYSQWSNVVRLEIVDALEPPVVKADSDAQGSRLTWKAQRPGLHYRVLRKTTATSLPIEVGIAEGPEFIDTGARYGTEYTYTVIAQDKGEHKDAESEPSAPVSITPEDHFPPTPPATITALATSNSIEVSWERSPEADTKGYFVYRSVDGKDFQRLGDLVTLPTFSDKDVQSGKKYRYEISAVDERNNESARSNQTEVNF